jgi:prepilin-type N-terminal cleavage/methylation domain-containing protein
MIRMMRQRIAKATAADEGFSLIELLIVVVILGVLSGIVVFAVQAFNGDGVLAACKADKKAVEVASEAFYAKSPTGARAANIAALVPTYLKEEPSTAKYTINYDATTGAVTSTLAGC